MKKLLLLAAIVLVSCDKLHEEHLENIGERVVALEASVLDFNSYIVKIKAVVNVIEENGYITRITDNVDGTYTLQMSTGQEITLRNGAEGKPGKDGTARELDISVAEDTDGEWYWTLNGEWMLDGNGNKMRVSPYDGKDGKDGEDDIDLSLPVPITRINNFTGNWEISTDSGVSWADTGVRANGRDGSNDQFVSFTLSEDGKTVTITLLDGRVFVVPVLKSTTGS
jgi:hypothetical protein